MTVDTEKLFIKADKEWDKGNLKIAFELFLEGAEAGHEACQDNVEYSMSVVMESERMRKKLYIGINEP